MTTDNNTLMERVEAADLDEVRHLLQEFTEAASKSDQAYVTAGLALAAQVPGLLALIERERVTNRPPF